MDDEKTTLEDEEMTSTAGGGFAPVTGDADGDDTDTTDGDADDSDADDTDADDTDSDAA
jgi:hypothetical protein